MKHTQVLTAVLAGVVAFGPVAQALAQAGDGGPLRNRLQSRMGAGLDERRDDVQAQIEGRVAAAIPDPGQAAQAAQVRQVQTALNFFTFDAGPVDGAMGQQTQTAIADYQRYLSYPVTGQLTEAEGRFLIGSWTRAQQDPATTQQVAATHPDGIRGLLLVYRDGLARPQTAAVGVMPTFSVTEGAAVSLADRCDRLAGAGLRPDAVAAPGTVDSATLALSLAVCGARDVVIADSTAAAARATGFTPDQIAQQCLDFAPALASLVALLPDSPPGDVAAAAAAFVQRSGQSPDQMAGIATTCLGVGYTAERMDLAIGSAQLLVGLAQAPYGELLGHHLALGLGVDARPDAARAWYTATATGATALASADAPAHFATLEAAARVLAAPPPAAPGAPVPAFGAPRAGD